MRRTDDEDSTVLDPAREAATDVGEAPHAPPDRGWRLQHNGALDGVRAIAVLLVIGVHSWFSKLPGGGIGVSVFFTLSGFLITALLLAEVTDTGRLSFKNFYMRRILRLFPALVALVAVVYVYSRITGVDQERIGPAAPAALFYYANWARVAGTRLGMLGHTWSLSVEEQFYLIWPLVLWVAFRVGRLWGVLAAAIVGALASTAVRSYLQANPFDGSDVRIQNGFDTQSVGIFVGCALATVLFLGWKPRRWMVGPVAVLAIWYVYNAVINIFKAKEAGDGVMPLLVAIGFAAVICWVVRWPGSVPARVLALAPIASIGRISYGLYLWHYPISAIVGRSGPKDSATALLVVLALSLPVATASYFLVERPFLRLKDRFRSTPSPALDAALPAPG